MTLTSIQTLRASAAIAVATTEYYVTASAAKKSSATTATTANKLTDSGGNFVVLAIAVGDIIQNVTTGKFALVTAVDSATALSVSADIFLSGNSYVIYDYTTNCIKLQQAFDQLVVTLDVTAAATDAGDTLDVMIDTSFDGGLKWVNLGHFTQVLGNGGAKSFVLVIKNDNPGTSAVFATTTDASAGVTRPIGVGDRIRFRSTTVDASTQNIGFTYSLKAFLK